MRTPSKEEFVKIFFAELAYEIISKMQKLNGTWQLKPEHVPSAEAKL
jgi:hypothetical protein